MEIQKEDQTNISRILLINFMLKVTKLVIIILNFSFFIGMIFFIFCDIENQIMDKDELHSENFFDRFGISERDPGELLVLYLYYAFTTLATVGFGDIKPISDHERIFISFIFVFGVAIFSFIMGIFI